MEWLIQTCHDVCIIWDSLGVGIKLSLWKKSRTHDIFDMKHKGDKVEEGTGTMTEAKCQGSETR